MDRKISPEEATLCDLWNDIRRFFFGDRSSVSIKGLRIYEDKNDCENLAHETYFTIDFGGYYLTHLSGGDIRLQGKLETINTFNMEEFAEKVRELLDELGDKVVVNGQVYHPYTANCDLAKTETKLEPVYNEVGRKEQEIDPTDYERPI